MNLEGVSKKLTYPYDGFCRLFFPIIPRALRPNHLTIIRFLGTPFFIYLLWSSNYRSALPLFVILALTDMFDGALARGRNQITRFGIMADPIADKFLIGSAVVIALLKVNFWLAVAVIFFDVFSLLIGLIAKWRNPAFDISSNVYGKVKLNLQVAGAILLIIGQIFNFHGSIIVAEGFFWSACFVAMLNIFKKGL